MNGDLLTTWAGETIFSVTLLMVIVMLIRRPVGKIFGPQIAYLLWAIPAARMLMPVLTITVEAPPEAAASAADPIAPIILDGEALAIIPQAPAFYEQPLFWLTLWLGGAALFLIYQLGSYIAQRDQLLTDAVSMGKSGNIHLIEVAEINGPFAFGLIRKYIALPIGFDRRYTRAQRDLILQHEVAHHRAGDLWVNAAALTVLSLHWFNPVAWLAWRQFRFDQEAACDARVISHKPLDQKQLYSAAIAKTATGQSLALASPLLSKNKLKERIKIMSMKEKTAAQKNAGRFLVGTALVSAMALTATVSYAVQTAPSPSIKASPAPLALAETPAPTRSESPAVPVPPTPLPPTLHIGAVDIMSETDSESGKKVYVHKIKSKGRTVILRTDRRLSDEEIAEAVAEADESRQEAEEARLEADEARKEALEHRIEVHKIEREIEQDVAEALREAGLSQKEARAIAVEARESAKKASRETMVEARKAISEARLKQAREWRSRNMRAPSSPATSAPIPAPAPASFITGSNAQSGQMRIAISMRGGQNIRRENCNQVSFVPSTHRGVMTETAYASIVECSGLKTGVDERALLEMTLDALKNARKSYAQNCDKSDTSQLRIVQAFDREIAHLNRKISYYG